MKNLLKITIVILISAFANSCVDDSFVTPTEECGPSGLVKTKEVQDIYNIATSSGPKYTGDDVIEAVVTSSDEGGNFFKVISMMSLDGTRGFSVNIDQYNLYTEKLQPGRKVLIKLKDLYTQRATGGTIGLALGDFPTGQYNTVSRLDKLDYKKFIIPTCTVIDEETFVKKGLTLAQLANDVYLNTLVEVDNVQFESQNVTYGNKPTEADKNENITDGSTSFITRTSKFANFAGNILPSGKGKIRGVVTRFGSSYQLIIRTTRDVNLTNPRTNFSIIVGTNLNFESTLNENFESYPTTPSPANRTFPKYINEALVGSRYWTTTAFGGNKYLQMSSFTSGQINRSLFYIPVNLTAANTFSFQSKAGFTNGTVLKVYYILASNYTPGGPLNNSNLVDITSSFTIPSNSPSGYPTNFTNSGNYNIPVALTGNGYFVFEYTGNGSSSPTTTMQIDNVIIN